MQRLCESCRIVARQTKRCMFLWYVSNATVRPAHVTFAKDQYEWRAVKR